MTVFGEWMVGFLDLPVADITATPQSKSNASSDTKASPRACDTHAFSNRTWTRYTKLQKTGFNLRRELKQNLTIPQKTTNFAKQKGNKMQKENAKIRKVAQLHGIQPLPPKTTRNNKLFPLYFFFSLLRPINNFSNAIGVHACAAGNSFENKSPNIYRYKKYRPQFIFFQLVRTDRFHLNLFNYE